LGLSVYQIYYNDQTKEMLDPGFLPVYNQVDSVRFPLFEYPAIFKCLEEAGFDSKDYFGCFSPRFFEKTAISSKEVIERICGDYDLYSFSPYFDQSALFENSFIQGDIHHPGFIGVAREALRMLGFQSHLAESIQSSEQIIFSNFFVARRWVFDRWRSAVTRLFDLCMVEGEANRRKELLDNTSHRGIRGTPMFIFMAERLISILLMTDLSHIKVKVFQDLQLKSIANDRVRRFIEPSYLCQLDRLKNEYLRHDNLESLTEYQRLRAGLMARLRI